MKDKNIKLSGGRVIGRGRPAFFIADVGANHNGSLSKAKKLIDIAKRSEVNAVKFQSYRADYIINKRYLPDGYELLKKCQIPVKWNGILKSYCDKKNILFMTTPFDVEIVDYLEKIGLECYKIASCDITFSRLLRRVAVTGKPAIISTGGASLAEIRNAVKIFREEKNNKIVLLHAVVNYPCDYNEVNLSFMPRLAKKFNVLYGLSDHSLGIEVSLAAVALGANVIEKHLTENRKQRGPDHMHSMEPREFAGLINSARIIEECLGRANKVINESEQKRMKRGRRSFYAIEDIGKGDVFSPFNIRELRPSGEIEANRTGIIYGKKAWRPIKKLEMVMERDIL